MNNERIAEIVEEIFEEVFAYMTRITDVVVEIYNSEWDQLFNNEAERLRPELGELKTSTNFDFYRIYKEYTNN